MHGRLSYIPTSMKRLIVTTCAIAILAACSHRQGRLHEAYAEAAGRMEECTAQFRQAVAKSAKAKVRRMSCTSEEEEEYPVPAEEYALLREIMLHTAAVPPALETTEPGWPEDFPCVVELIFADTHGGDLTGIVVNYERWMPQSEAKKLRPAPARPWDTPDWSLPDADLAALHALPCMQHAKALSHP